MAARKAQLSVEDWLLAGFRALVQRGPNAIGAEMLAREMGTTKGSFYWHFADVADFRNQLLAFWQLRAFTDIVSRIEAEPDPWARLRALSGLAVSFCDPHYGGAALEPAVRAWACSDAAVDAAVSIMDARRLNYLDQLCKDCGLADPNLSRIIYAAVVGLEVMDKGDSPKSVATMMALMDLLEAGYTKGRASRDLI